MTELFVTVGRLGKTRGVNGELYIIPETDFPRRFLDMRYVYLRKNDQWEKVNVESSRMVSGRPVIKLEGFDSPEAAARMTNREIGVPKDEIASLPKDAFWIFDLIGCEVIEETTGKILGELTAVETYPANDVYIFKTPDGRELMIAAVDKFVKKVDIAGRKIFIDEAGILEQ